MLLGEQSLTRTIPVEVAINVSVSLRNEARFSLCYWVIGAIATFCNKLYSRPIIVCYVIVLHENSTLTRCFCVMSV